VAAPSALRRCIVNLVDNAVRYGGSAHITLHDGATELRIAVQDSGPGIAEAELPQVLQPFHRLEASRNRSTGGVGLGLAIAHDIARQHCGTLVLHNALPTGLVATLTLPR
jgi:protein-histidine pros-kinase